ncbi:pyridoxal phosphate-dependent aminotransferase [Terriglobus tenax]|uniref:pyridoxal phosphate-dependent aminotransferase n=1 Tax=Terriglobus tenax TaxID=1111115 RepID=UPI0021E05907|nr:pyridoxal phosphate-dependent aminotransferase [Terriglobus tenax]
MSSIFDVNSAVSRRNFVRLFGAGAAAAATLPNFSQSAFAQAAGQAAGRRGPGMAMGERPTMDPSVIVISSNENPLGPAPSALEAVAKAGPTGGRYDKYGVGPGVVKTLSEQFGLKPGYVQLYPGSGGPLDMALMSNISTEKGLVTADPSYEQGSRAAMKMKAPLKQVALNAKYEHDVKAMLAADPNAGAYYIVNPNNPTGTMTPKEDIIWLIDHKPKGSVVIVDEAYHHFSTHESIIDQVAADKDVIVLRTFSKIYGMAGVRAGFAIARPDLLAKFDTLSPSVSLRQAASVSLLAAAAAGASLRDPELVPLRRKINTDIRESTLEFLDKKGYKIVPGSQANMFMVDVKRPGREFSQLMMKEKIAIGRSWSAMPNYVRVTVGTKEEMDKFQVAFVKCMDIAPGATSASLHSEIYIPSELHRA